MEDEYKDISPLYMQRLKGQVENVLWNLFEGSKYRQMGQNEQKAAIAHSTAAVSHFRTRNIRLKLSELTSNGYNTVTLKNWLARRRAAVASFHLMLHRICRGSARHIDS